SSEFQFSGHAFSHAPFAQSAGTRFSRTLFASDTVCKGGTMMRDFIRSAAILLMAIGFVFGPAASAQVQSPSPDVSQQPQNIPDQKRDAAAAAIGQVASLKQDYQQRIAAAAPADKERLMDEAVKALSKAVTDQGLSVDEYDSILEVAQNN